MGRRWEEGCWAGAKGRGATVGPDAELKVESDAELKAESDVKAALGAELQVGPARQGKGRGRKGAEVV